MFSLFMLWDSGGKGKSRRPGKHMKHKPLASHLDFSPSRKQDFFLLMNEPISLALFPSAQAYERINLKSILNMESTSRISTSSLTQEAGTTNGRDAQILAHKTHRFNKVRRFHPCQKKTAFQKSQCEMMSQEEGQEVPQKFFPLDSRAVTTCSNVYQELRERETGRLCWHLRQVCS